jgi:hypothetical protein
MEPPGLQTCAEKPYHREERWVKMRVDVRDLVLADGISSKYEAVFSDELQGYL